MNTLAKNSLKGVVIAAAILAAGVSHAAQKGRFGYAAMPDGITLQPLGSPQGYEGQRLYYHVRKEIVYANDKGLTLYTFDKDQAGKIACVDDCTKEWAPLVPLAGVKATPNWTIIARPGGVKQWAYEGKPLYTSAKDKEPGEVGGGGIGDGRIVFADAQGGDGPGRVQLPDGWHAAMFRTGGVAVIAVKAPPGLSIQEVPNANGLTLVDSHKLTIYAYEGTVDKDAVACSASPCALKFVPVVAPQLADARGDWTFAKRKDGIHQWAYKGLPLYTYSGDHVSGDVYGASVDKRWHVAIIESHFMPASVQLRHDPGLGPIMTDARGHSLYHRDVQAFTPGSRQTYHDRLYRPRVGRSIAMTECNATCAKEFEPFLAPANALPNGYWNTRVRADGAKQWTYNDFALYTYKGDKKPGDLNANNIYDLTVSDDPTETNAIGYPVLSGAGLFWMYSGL